MRDETHRRLASNEDVFREVNEGIVRGQWPGEPDSPVGFRCECARLGCNVLLALSVSEYERVRADPRWFVLLAGHQLPEVERVVQERGQYVIVEKIEEAGKEAERLERQSQGA
jgi:hypothetical protein